RARVRPRREMKSRVGLVRFALERRRAVQLLALRGEDALPARAALGLQLHRRGQGEREGQCRQVRALALELDLCLGGEPGLERDLVDAVRRALGILVREALDAEGLPALLGAADAVGGRVELHDEPWREHAERVVVGRGRTAELDGLGRHALVPLEIDLVGGVDRPLLDLQLRLQRCSRLLALVSWRDDAAAVAVARLTNRARRRRARRADAALTGV